MKEKIEEKLNEIEERIKLSKENGCKLLKCKTIDRNIALQLENIKLKKIANILAEELTKLTEENKEYYLDWAKSEVENE